MKRIARLAPEVWFRTTLVPNRLEPTRLYLDTRMRETAGVGVGDSVHVALQPDHEPREILVYLNFLKTPEAVERNVRKTIANLLK